MLRFEAMIVLNKPNRKKKEKKRDALNGSQGNREIMSDTTSCANQRKRKNKTKYHQAYNVCLFARYIFNFSACSHCTRFRKKTLRRKIVILFEGECISIWTKNTEYRYLTIFSIMHLPFTFDTNTTRITLLAVCIKVKHSLQRKYIWRLETQREAGMPSGWNLSLHKT